MQHETETKTESKYKAVMIPKEDYEAVMAYTKARRIAIGWFFGLAGMQKLDRIVREVDTHERPELPAVINK